MEENNKYSLAFKVEKKNPMPIEIEKIDPSFEKYNVKSLETIDFFTGKYSNNELMNVIRKSNIITEEYLNGKLIIINHTTGWKHDSIVLSDFGNNEVMEFLYQNINDNSLMNKIYNKSCNYTSLDYDKEYCYNLFLTEKNIKIFFTNYFKLPYLMRREILFLCLNIHKEKQKQKLKKVN